MQVFGALIDESITIPHLQFAVLARHNRMGEHFRVKIATAVDIELETNASIPLELISFYQTNFIYVHLLGPSISTPLLQVCWLRNAHV